MKRLSRLSAILVLLQSRRWLTAREVAKKFDIALRTAYRDFDALVESGVPLISVPSKGFSLVDGYTIPPIMFTEDEANALILAEKIIEQNSDQSLIEGYKEAINKVKSVLRESQKDKLEFIQTRTGPSIDRKLVNNSNFLVPIQRAVSNGKRVEIIYHSLSKEETTRREVDPLGVYFTEKNWVLIGFCYLRNDLREFRLDKMSACFTLSKNVEERDFSLKQHFERNY